MEKEDKENHQTNITERIKFNFLSNEVSKSAFIQTDNALCFFLHLQKNVDTS